ncbi:MAG: vWA domain-containing protein [Candidatus Bathyarchaeia archaeon]
MRMGDGRGQMRIIEALIACLIILFAYFFLSRTSVSSQKNVELTSISQNLLSTLENQDLLISIIEDDSDWASKLDEIIRAILPPDIFYNVTFRSLVTGESIGGVTNLNFWNNVSHTDSVTVQGVYTFSYPYVQLTDILLDIVMVMDRSGSMNWKIPGDPQPKIYYTKLAANNFIDRLNTTTDRVGLTSFATTSTIDAYLTFDHSYVKSKVNSLNPSGWTNMEGGINKANVLFDDYGRENATWVMIILSDGVANWWDGNPGPENEALGCRYAAEKAQVAKDMGVKIYTIGLGDPSYLNETLLREIQTDGYYFAPSAQDLNSIYQSIAEDLIYDVKYDMILITVTLMQPVYGGGS